MVLTLLPPPVGDGPTAEPTPATTVRAEGAGTVVVMGCEGHRSVAPVLSEALSRIIVFRSGTVVVDLAGLECLDTAAVRVLASARRMLDREGRRLTVRSPSRLVRRILAVFSMSDVIEAAGATRR